MVYRYGRMTVEELIKWEILQREKELLENQYGLPKLYNTP
jgi:hypothetical protein